MSFHAWWLPLVAVAAAVLFLTPVSSGVMEAVRATCRPIRRTDRVMPVHCLRHLALCLFGYHTSFRHGITAFTHQALVDRQVIVSG